MDRRLGGLLPRQLSNPTRAHLPTINLWRTDHAVCTCHAVLASVSERYPPSEGRLLTRYSPVRHWSESRRTRHRSTWMCYARRQRLSWARIKLSKYCISTDLSANTYLKFVLKISLSLFLITCCSSILLFRNQRDLLSIFSAFAVQISKVVSSSFSLFCFQGSLAVRSRVCRSRRQLC